jgi:hypothetical protein
VTDPGTIGRLLIGAGLALVLIGGVVLLAGRVPVLGWLGRLPGDIVLRRGPVTVYVPLLTSILLSVLLTIAANLFLRR